MTKTSDADTPFRLVDVEVFDLLGMFDHHVPFRADWDFVILHGPNGVGKTKMLELLYSTLTGRFGRVAELPFAAASLRFSDGSHLGIRRTEQLTLEDAGSGDDVRHGSRVDFRYQDADGEDWFWTADTASRPELSPSVLRALERDLPLSRAGHDLWVDVTTGEELTLNEISERWPGIVPASVFASTAQQDARVFLERASVSFIETQRLLTLHSAPVRTRARPGSRRPTVLAFAEDLSRRLAEALAANSRVSQELDRTFPMRVLRMDVGEAASDEEIRKRYADQLSLRARLSGISVLETGEETPEIPEDRTLADWERRVLGTYLEDAERKLGTFRDLLDRAELLEEIVNERFLFKELHIDRDEGFRVTTAQGEHLSAAQLSSGEQHELVLFYELLFKVPHGSLVLIDEPEISLHVAWQLPFLADIQRIAALRELRFIVATHSPQIVDRWWDRAIPLVRPQSGPAAG